MAQDIKQKITLEGEKEYNAALKQAQRHLRTLKSELKAETAELGNNANAQDKARVKSENLRKQIKEQEKVVKTLKTALEAAKAEYGDNEEVVGKWEQKLNEARASLANMKNELDGVTSGVKEVNAAAAQGVTATRSFAEAIEKIGDAGGNISGALERTFTNVLDVVRDAVAELWGLVSETAARANEWTDIAEIWNTDPAKIERYARGVQYAGKSFSDLQNAVSKIATGDAEKIQKLTGVSWAGDTDEWQYAMDVLSSISGMEYSKKLETLSEIFGDKRAAGVMDIVNAWGTILEGGDKLTEGGYGLGEGALSTMNEVQERVEMFSASWEALKDNVAAGLGKATLPLIIDAQGALDGFAQFLNAESPEEQEEALKKIEENITQFCEDVAAAIRNGLDIIGRVGEGLQQSDDPITRSIGSALVKLKKTLEWFMDENNWGTIKAALEAFFGLWLAGKGAQALAAVAAFAANAKVIMGFKGLGGLNLFGGGGGSAAADTATKVTNGGGWLAGMIKGAAPNAIVAAALYEMFKGLPANFLSGGSETQKIIDEINAAHGINTMGDVIDQGLKTDQARNQRTMGFLFGSLLHPGESAPGITEEANNGVYASAAQRAAAEEFWDAYRKNPDGFSDDTWNAFESAFAGSEDVFDKLNEVIDLFVQRNNENDEWRGVENLPEWMFNDPGTSGGENGITSGDLQGFRNLPGQLQAAARAGTAAGVSGIRVELDGAAVGRMVAPEVSRIIAADILG